MRRAGYQRGALQLRRGQWSVRYRIRDAATKSWSARRVQLGASSRLKTRAAARLAADRLLERLAISAPITGQTILFEAFVEIYLEEQLSRMQPTTLSSYRSILDHHLVPILKGTALHEISGRKPGAIVGALARARLARPSIRAAMGVLGRLLDVASELGYASIPLNRRSYRLPPAPARREPRCFTPREARAIIEKSAYPWKAFYALMAFAGLRCSEALGIEWQHVDLVKRLLHIRQAAAMGKLKAVKSSNSAADLPMPDELHAVLEEFREHTGHTDESPLDLLFESPQGGPYWASAVYRTHFHPLLKRLGMPAAGLHAFRHGHATNLFAGGASAPVVRGMLRHGDIKTTLRYTHTTGEDMRIAAAAAGRIVGEAR